MILTQGLNAMVSDVRDDMTNGEAGTGTTLFQKVNTGVETAIGSTDIALTDKTVSGSTINLTYILDTTLARLTLTSSCLLSVHLSVIFSSNISTSVISTTPVYILKFPSTVRTSIVILFPS